MSEIVGTPTVILVDDVPTEIPDRPARTSAWTDEAIDADREKDAKIVQEVRQADAQPEMPPMWMIRAFPPQTILKHNGVDAKILHIGPEDGKWLVLLEPLTPAAKPKSERKALYHRLMREHGKKKAKRMMETMDNPKCKTCGVDETFEGKLDFEHKSRSEHRRLVVQLGPRDEESTADTTASNVLDAKPNESEDSTHGQQGSDDGAEGGREDAHAEGTEGGSGKVRCE